MKNVGLFFGTFNPIHKGHLAVANYFAENTRLEEVWFVVSPHNPFKDQSDLLVNTHRLKMVELAIENHPKLKACDIEFGLPTPNYTCITLEHLCRQFSAYDFVLLLGQDNLIHFDKWKNYLQILENYSLYIYPRKGNDAIPESFSNHPKIRFFKAPEIVISATAIRKKIETTVDLSQQLPLSVLHYIKTNALYLDS